MPKYDIPVWKMIEEAAKELPEVFTAADIVRKVRQKRPQVKASTLRAHVIALAPNHPTSKHYSLRQKLFFYLGNGRYRLLRPDDSQVPETQALDEEKQIEETESREFSFEFEADLESHLETSITDIEAGLELYKSPDGISGRQFSTPVGPIDLLANDREGNFVVIEIKVGVAGDKTLGQLLRYMGWVQRHLSPSKRVRGIIVSREVTNKLRYAASMLENVLLKEYEVRFEFSDAELELENDE